MLDHLPETALNLFSALVLGCAIGFERQWHQRMAGLRTNTLVAIGAAIFVTFAALIPGESSPTRMAAQVVSGIGFLGAGIIFKEGLNVRGLNTAATLWCSAGVGTLCGAGFYPHAAICTLFVIAVNLLLRPLVRAIELRLPLAPDLKSIYTVSIVCHGEREADVRALLLRDVGTNLHIQEIESTNIEDSNRVEVNATMRADQRQDRLIEQIIGRLSLEPLVTSARWRFDRI
ncbi:MgtC/SapB family protein [Aureimonas sp. AU40]|uniref:MgtC/SapB family protein n=1 Tax=Aureimonas sp. AU40 TaxID=1637747 RepID=UPI0007819C84|nr:MgtC/SapB family protein [Aureimonas sp. AU40]